MLHAVIMAGGSGTRFWPASRQMRPKQLLCLTGDRSMIQATVDRLSGLVPPDRQRVITSEMLCSPIAEQLPELPRTHIIGEPFKRDTAPCVGLAAALIAKEDPDATMVVMPSDHVIAQPDAFRRAVTLAEQLIDQDPERIVTFGIRPSYPAESFGYVEAGEAISPLDDTSSAPPIHDVLQFREKPDRSTAERYLASGRFYWNSGIFVWRASTILGALARYEPTMYAHIREIDQAIGTPSYQETLKREFAAIVGKSIDYAVMERHPNVVVMEAPFSWDDVGSWQALARLHPADQEGNTIVGSHVGIDTKNTIVYVEGSHTVVTIEIADLVIVHTPDATLVAPKRAEERVREAVAALASSQLDALI